MVRQILFETVAVGESSTVTESSSWGETGLNAKCRTRKLEFTANKEDGGQWMENYEEEMTWPRRGPGKAIYQDCCCRQAGESGGGGGACGHIKDN